MTVLQLIDSLRPGGAEKMAVNISNALLPHVERSFLCCTRQEGILKNKIKPEVGYLFLNKKNALDLKAIWSLRKYITDNEITIVHAHSTSFFIAGLLKISGSDFELIWHDHYGESKFLKKRKYKVLKNFSRFFTGIFSVNTDLKNWAIKNLHCKRVLELKNFIPEPPLCASSQLNLNGVGTDFKIICLANLRPQKDHFNLLEAFEMLDPNLGISLHLIGEDPRTSYSKKVLKKIDESPVRQKIFYYGVQQEVIPLLKLADVGILSSNSEGLPLALLEYGFAGLAVITTDVGQCREIIGNTGIVVKEAKPLQLAEAIFSYFSDKEKTKEDAKKFKFRIQRGYSQKVVIPLILEFYSVK